MSNKEEKQEPAIQDDLEDLPTNDNFEYTPQLARKIAKMSFAGMSQREVQKVTGISISRIRKIYTMQAFKAYREEAIDSIVKDAKITIIKGVSDLSVEVVRVLKHKLRKDDMQAVNTAIRLLGLENKGNEQPGTKAPGITVIFASDSKQTINKKDDVAVSADSIKIEVEDINK